MQFVCPSKGAAILASRGQQNPTPRHTGMITKYLEFFKIYYCSISTSIEVHKIAAPAIVISVALTPKSDI